jgi:hypothetical protein
MSSPSPGASFNILTAVSAVSANDVWAVGRYITSSGTTQSLVMHWDGTEWSVVSSPNPGTSYNTLDGVWAVSANDIWAVGYYFSGSDTPRTLVMHWDGGTWTVVPSPNIGASSNFLSAVSAVSADDVWASGYYLNGFVIETLMVHWDGTEWSVVPSPNVGTDSNTLRDVTAISSNDVWAVGDYYDNNLIGRTLVMHWDGTDWTVIPSPNVGSNHNVLHGVEAVSTNDVWAVGWYGVDVVGSQTLVMHWDGETWSVVPSPNQGTRENQLRAVSFLSADDVWAVGDYRSYPGEGIVHQVLVERYSCLVSTTVTPVPTGTPTCADQFADVPLDNTFYPFVRCMACEGIIEGYTCGGEGEPCNSNNDPYFRPNSTVTRGQIAKIVSESAGFTDIVPPTQQSFDDVIYGSPFWEYVERLSTRGIIDGYQCGINLAEPCVPPENRPYFRPNAGATRGQLVKIASEAAGFDDQIPETQYSFTDVEPGHTFWIYIERLLLNRPDAISGYPCGGPGEPCDSENRPYFRPNNGVTRGQASKITSNTFFPGCDPPGP